MLNFTFNKCSFNVRESARVRVNEASAIKEEMINIVECGYT